MQSMFNSLMLKVACDFDATKLAEAAEKSPNHSLFTESFTHANFWKTC